MGREAARVHNLLDNASGRLSKWRVLDAHRTFSDLPRQRTCGLDAAWTSVTVGRHADRVVFSGARACNLRTCVNCGPRIQALNRDRIRIAVAKARALDFRVFMLTLTVRHTAADDLAELLASEAAAWRGLTSGGWYVRTSRLFGLQGFIKVTETTYGDHGFHPHLHVLLFVDPAEAQLSDVGAFRAQLTSRWRHLAGAAGLEADVVGQDMTEATDADVDRISGYFTKQHSADGLHWEMTSSATKRTARTLSPDELLAAGALGDSASQAAFRALEVGTKGRRLIDFSRRLSKRLALLPLGEVEPQIRDEEPVGSDRLVSIPDSEWAEATRRPGLVPDLAELVEAGADGYAVYAWLRDRGIRAVLHVDAPAPPGPLVFADGSPAHDDGSPRDLPF